MRTHSYLTVFTENTHLKIKANIKEKHDVWEYIEDHPVFVVTTLHIFRKCHV